MNTRLHVRLEHEHDTLGPYILSRGEDFTQKLPQTDKENRQLLIASVDHFEHVQISPMFKKQLTRN